MTNNFDKIFFFTFCICFFFYKCLQQPQDKDTDLYEDAKEIVDSLRELVRNKQMLDPLGHRHEEVEIAQEDILKKVALYLKKHGNEGVKDDIVLSFWDFAGQELYYATHQVHSIFNRRKLHVQQLCLHYKT